MRSAFDSLGFPYDDIEANCELLSTAGYDGWITPEFGPYNAPGDRMPAQALDTLRAVFE